MNVMVQVLTDPSTVFANNMRCSIVDMDYFDFFPKFVEFVPFKSKFESGRFLQVSLQQKQAKYLQLRLDIINATLLIDNDPKLDSGFGPDRSWFIEW
jgi:hypothetical protein